MLFRSGDTDEAFFPQEGAVTRIGRRVLVEYEGKFFCEEYSSTDVASARYNELIDELDFSVPEC